MRRANSSSISNSSSIQSGVRYRASRAQLPGRAVSISAPPAGYQDAECLGTSAPLPALPVAADLSPPLGPAHHRERQAAVLRAKWEKMMTGSGSGSGY